MSNQFGGSSTKRLFNLHEQLSLLCCDVLIHHDISILCTTRNKVDQTEAFDNGFSHAKFGESPHNFDKALAVDVGLWDPAVRGINYQDIEAFKRITDCFKSHAEGRGIKIRCGIDWDFQDMPHIEIEGWREMVPDSCLVTG